MSLKPRQSVLDLFDPLLSDALRAPLPETPPLTPQCFGDERAQDTRLPDDLMVLFFSHFSEQGGTFSSRAQESGCLVDVNVGQDTDINSEILSHDLIKNPTKTATSSLQSTTPPYFRDINQSENAEMIVPGLVLPDTTTESLISMSLSSSPGDKQAMLSPTIDSYLKPFRDNSRRRSSIDISRTLSSFSSSVQELPGFNVDLLKEEPFPLSEFSEEDSLQCLHEMETSPSSVWKAQEAAIMATITSRRSIEITENIKAAEDRKVKTPLDDKKDYPRSTTSVNDRMDVAPKRLKDTSNCQPVNVINIELPHERSGCTVSSLYNDVVSAPRRPKVFTLNHHQSQIGDQTDNMQDSVLKVASELIPRPLGSKDGVESAPGKTIPRLQRPPIGKHGLASAPESKIPSRVTVVPSENTNPSQSKLSATIPKTFGGPSRIAVPLKKRVKKIE